MGPVTVNSKGRRFSPSSALGSMFLAGCLLASHVSLTGCGASKPGGTLVDPATGSEVTYEVQQPGLTNIAPNNIALGDTVTVLGKNFIDPAHGTLSLYMTGTYTKDNGGESRYEGRIPLTYVSPGQAKFQFDKLLFSDSGKELGTFNGTFNVVNKLQAAAKNADVGDEETSEGRALGITTLPSIYVNQMRSVDGDCPAMTPGTTPGSNMAFGFEVIGMDEATVGDPITFSYTFQAPNLVASYVENTPYYFPPYTGDGAPTPPMDSTGTTEFSYDITSGTSTTLDPHNVTTVVTLSSPIDISQTAKNQTQVKLAKLATGKADSMASPAGTNYFNMTVTATRGDGTTIVRTLNVPIHAPLEVGAASAEVLAGRESAQVLTGCVGGGQFGEDYQYTKGSSITRQRTINLTWNTQFSKNWNASVNGNVGLQFGITAFGVPNVQLGGSVGGGGQWTQTFGVDFSEAVTAEEHKGETFSIHILPAFSLVLYGQFFWLQRSAPLLLHTSCGEALEAGTATLNNPQWHFDPEQSTTSSCDPPNTPATKLKPAQGYTPSSGDGT